MKFQVLKAPVDVIVKKVGDNDEVGIHVAQGPAHRGPEVGNNLPYAASIDTEEVMLTIRGRKRCRVVSEGSVLGDTAAAQGLVSLSPNVQRHDAQHKRAKRYEEEFEWDDIYSADAGLPGGDGVEKDEQRGRQVRRIHLNLKKAAPMEVNSQDACRKTGGEEMKRDNGRGTAASGFNAGTKAWIESMRRRQGGAYPPSM